LQVLLPGDIIWLGAAGETRLMSSAVASQSGASSDNRWIARQIASPIPLRPNGSWIAIPRLPKISVADRTHALARLFQAYPVRGLRVCVGFRSAANFTLISADIAPEELGRLQPKWFSGAHGFNELIDLKIDKTSSVPDFAFLPGSR
jgi:hypothetical protein